MRIQGLLLVALFSHLTLGDSGDGDDGDSVSVFGTEDGADNKADRGVVIGTTPKLFEGDIVLDPRQRRIVDKAIQTGNAIEDVDTQTFGASSKAYKRWPNGIIYYTIDRSLSNDRRATAAIYAGMAEWKSKTCISFQRRTNQRSYLEFFRGNGCWGYIGMGPGKIQISVGRGCEYRHVMTHEIGHVVGFWHEQSRADRDQYIRIVWANVPRSLYEAFAKYGRDKVDSLGVSYDYGSIMHYPWNAFSVNGRNTVVPLRRVDRQPYKVLSDKDALQANRMYGCSKKPLTTAPPKPQPSPVTPRPTQRPLTECKIVEVTVTQSVRVAPCRQSMSRCRYWHGRGECRRNPRYMNIYCACVCGAGGSCRDENYLCGSWASRGECSRNPSFMLLKCRKSCGKCGTTTKKVKKCYTLPPPATTQPSPPPPPSPPIPSPPIPSPTPPTTPKPDTKPPTTLPPVTPPPVTGKPTPPLPSDCKIFEPAGLGSFEIPDKNLQASSSHNRWHGPNQGRLNLRAGQRNGVGAWCAKTQDTKQYFQIDLGEINVVKAVATQGRPSIYDKHVSTYHISFSNDGKAWTDYVTPSNTWMTKEFDGNVDQYSTVTNYFHPPIIGRYVRIHPLQWRAMICLRAEIYVCEKDDGSGSGSGSGTGAEINKGIFGLFAKRL